MIAMKTSEIISLCALLFTISYAVVSEIIKFFSNRKRKSQQEQIDALDERLTVAQEKMNTKLGELKEGNEKNSRMIIKALILINGKKIPTDDEEFSEFVIGSKQSKRDNDKDSKAKNERNIVFQKMKQTGKK